MSLQADLQPNPPAPAADRKDRKNKSTADFWRACRFLGPHRALVFISIGCAFVVGLTFTSGLGTLLPVLRVLINGDTVPAWVQRQNVENRLGATIAQESTDLRETDRQPSLRLVVVKKDSPAARAGLKSGDTFTVPGDNVDALEFLSSPQIDSAVIQITGRPTPAKIDLDRAPGYLRFARICAMHLPSGPVWSIGAVLCVLLALTVFGNFVRFFQEFLSEKAAILTVNDMRKLLYDHVLHIPMEFFGLRGTSDVTSRLVQDAAGLQEGFKLVLGQSIQEPIKVIMAFGLALWFDWHLTLFIVLFGPLMFAIIKKFGKKMRRATRKALQNSALMLGQLEGTLGGIRVVKAAQAERFERRRYRRIMQGLTAEQTSMSRIDAMSTPILEVLTLLVVCCIVLTAAWLVRVRHTLDATMFMGLMACLMSIGESLRKCSKINNSLQKANAAAARIFEMLDIPVERRRNVFTGGRKREKTAPARSLVKLPPMQRDIRFEDIAFSYPGASAPALSGINLNIAKGKCIAVVGRNGSGKTTLLALLPRFYDPQSGRVLIDGVDVRNATLHSLRKQIGIVTQEAVVFPGTIAENIAYGLPQAPRDQIIQAAQRAFAHDFIMEKPQGYDTVLGGQGSQLSGGQRQRLCIARAILRQTPILILDEATSQVDAESEHLIQQAIESLMHERTTFVIAHRFSTILSADTIVVMERGQIVGQGSHDQLLTDCPIYQQLYERQLISTPTAETTA